MSHVLSDEEREMVLEHYSAEHVEAVRSVAQLAEPRPKPQGFWVSVKGEDDWPSWCESETYELERLATRHRVTLADDARILHLPSVEDVLAFHDRHSRPARRTSDMRYIDWQPIARQFQGIIITPYQWKSRIARDISDWYYTWDCASGCIWDAAAIARIEVEQVDRIRTAAEVRAS